METNTANIESILRSAGDIVHNAEFERQTHLDNKLDALGVYYSHSDGRYYVKDPRRNAFTPANRVDLGNFLVGMGFSKKKQGERSEVDEIFEHVYFNRAVDFAGPLGGYKAGHRQVDRGRKVLITSDTTPVEAKQSDWTILRVFLDNLLGDQVDYFHGWMQHALKMWRNQTYNQGQVCTMVGPPDCGKSLLIKTIVEATGGVSGLASRYFAGKTDFNGDVMQSSIVVMDDDVAEYHPKIRERMASAIKNHFFSGQHRLHPKGKDAITGPSLVLQRMIIASNDSDEDLEALPALREGFDDKIHLFLCSPAIPDWVDEPGRDLVRELYECVPGYFYFIENEFRLDAEMANRRYGVKTYHHPRVVQDMRATSPAGYLLDLLHDVYFCDEEPEHVKAKTEVGGAVAYKVCANDVFSALVDSGERSIQERAKSVARTPKTIGKQLAYLCKHHPDIVEKDGTISGRQYYLIKNNF